MNSSTAQRYFLRAEYFLTSFGSRVCSSTPSRQCRRAAHQEFQRSHVQLAHTTHRPIRRDDRTNDGAIRRRIAAHDARRRRHPDEREASALAVFPWFSLGFPQPRSLAPGVVVFVEARSGCQLLLHSSFAEDSRMAVISTLLNRPMTAAGTPGVGVRTCLSVFRDSIGTSRPLPGLRL